MSIFRLCLGGAFALALLFAAGCDNSIPKDNLEPLPQAMDDANGLGGGLGKGTGLEDANAWKDGANDGSLSKNPNDWTPVDPGNNLGFPIVYFGYDTDVLPPSETAKLDRVSKYLAEHGQLVLIIEGHCDERGTEEYNRALGERRANAIRSYLAGVGLEDGRMKTISYGEDRPAVNGSDEAAWSKNRRGVLVPAKKN